MANDMTGQEAPPRLDPKLPVRQMRTVSDLLVNENAKKMLGDVAAKHMNPDRMMRLLSNAMRTTPKLRECEPLSLLGALMTCAQIGLEANNVLGHAYLIPFWNGRLRVTEVQLIVGYKGFKQLALRHDAVVSIHADVAYDDDELWSFEYGSNMHLRHKPGPREGNPTHAYCHVTLKDGQAFIVLPWSQVLKTRDRSQNWQNAVKRGKTESNPWTTDLHAMGAKTAVRALANAGDLPMSFEIEKALELDEKKADFGRIPIDPDSDITIEGEVVEEEPEGDPDSEKPEEEKAKPAARRHDDEEGPPPRPQHKQANGAESKAAPKAETKPEETEGEIPEEFQSIVSRIKGDLEESKDGGEVENTVDLFSDQLALLDAQCRPAYDDVAEAIDAARERVAK